MEFTDSNWTDKTATKTVYTVNGLTVRHNGAASGINGFKFDKTLSQINWIISIFA